MFGKGAERPVAHTVLAALRNSLCGRPAPFPNTDLQGFADESIPASPGSATCASSAIARRPRTQNGGPAGPPYDVSGFQPMRYIVRSRLAFAAASENSATSTEMLCWMGFHLHFFTSATSAMGM